MSKLDEELTGRFGKAERPLPVDPQLFAGLLKRRVRRERLKRASTVGLVLVIGLTGAMAYVLAERGETVQPGSTATVSPALPSQAAVGATIPGVPFPACHTTSLVYYTELPGYGPISMFARGTSTDCPDVAAGNAYLGFNVGRIGPGPKPIVFGPIDCAQGCRIFGAPDIQGEGRPVLAVVVVDGTGADSIELYRIDPKADPPFTQIDAVVDGKRLPLSFDWGGEGTYRSGANCYTSGPAGTGDELVVWYANERGGVWHLVQRFLRIRGTLFRLDHVERSAGSGAKGFLPDGGGTDFCGAPVTP